MKKIDLPHFCKMQFVESVSDKIIYPENYDTFLEGIQSFEVRDDDVYVMGFPKTGTRWTQELTWLLLNDLNFEMARDVPLVLRSPFIDIEGIQSIVTLKYFNLEEISHLPSPRCMKTHLHWSTLPETIRSGTKQPKIIVLLRGPEDVCTSFYYQILSYQGFNGTFEDFCCLFLEEKVPGGPFWKHVLGYWEQRHRSNILFVKYDEMKEDLSVTIRNIANFIGKVVSNDDIEKLCEYLKFNNLKNIQSFNNKSVVNSEINPYARKGIVGDHKNHMSSSLIQKFREQKEKYLAGTELTL